MTRYAAVAAATLVLAACGADRAEPDMADAQPDSGVFDMPYLMRDLDNGLRVIIVPTDYPDIVSLQIPVQVGSRNETEPGKSGFAHFFEHMMFRGTENYSQDEYLEIVNEAGAKQNAYTTDDYTNYYIDFTKADLEKILEIEADRFRNLSYPEDVFRTEALAVKGEYLKNYSNPTSKAYERLRDLAFDRHTYGHTTMGFIEDIEQMPEQYEYSKTFFDRWYRPEKTSIILVGDLDPETTFQLVKKYWGGWERGSHEADIPEEGPPAGPHYDHIQWEVETQPWIFTALRGPAFDAAAPDMPAMDVIASLYFSNSSELYRRLVLEEQSVDQLLTHFPNREDPHVLMIYARLTDPSHADDVETAIRETLADVRSKPVSGERLAETRSRLKYAFAGNLDSSRTIGGMLAGYVRFARTPETVNTLYRSYDSLTPDVVREVANRYFTDARRVTVTLSNGTGLGNIDGTASVDALVEPVAAGESGAGRDDAEVRQALPEETGVDSSAPGPVEIVTLPSGSSALVDVSFLFHVGAALDPPGKRGLAALTAAMITDGGSAAYAIEEINDLMYPIASGFNAQVDKEMTRLSGQVHRDNLERWYRLASGQLLAPAFSEKDFRRVRTRQKNALRTSLVGNNDEELAKEVLYARIYGPEHPYGWPNLGESDDLDAITLDDVRAFYRQHYTTANLTVGLAGGYPEGFETRVGNDVARLPAGERAAIDVPAPPGAAANRAVIVQKETPAVAVSFGFPVELVRGDPDWLALWLVRSWLGEHRVSTGKLYRELRETRGMNYGDYAYIEYFPRGMFQMLPDTNLARQQQIFQVWLRPLRSNNDAHFATRAAMLELRQLIEDGMREEDFEATRRYLAKNVSLLTDGQTRQLGYALDSRHYRLDAFSDYVRDGLARLTLEDVNRTIREQLRTAEATFVFVTRDAQDLGDRLVEDRPSPLEYDAGMPDAVLERDRLIESFSLPFAPGDVGIVEAGRVFR